MNKNNCYTFCLYGGNNQLDRIPKCFCGSEKMNFFSGSELVKVETKYRKKCVK